MRWLVILVFLATLGVACGSSSDSGSNTSEVNMADETVTTASGLQTVSYTHLRAHET